MKYLTKGADYNSHRFTKEKDFWDSHYDLDDQAPRVDGKILVFESAEEYKQYRRIKKVLDDPKAAAKIMVQTMKQVKAENKKLKLPIIKDEEQLLLYCQEVVKNLAMEDLRNMLANATEAKDEEVLACSQHFSAPGQSPLYDKVTTMGFCTNKETAVEIVREDAFFKDRYSYLVYDAQGKEVDQVTKEDVMGNSDESEKE